MKRFGILALALTILAGAAVIPILAQDAGSGTTDTTKKKKKKKKTTTPPPK